MESSDNRILEIKSRVETTKDSYRSIAKDFGTSHTQIKNYIDALGWNIDHRSKKNTPVEVPAHRQILGKIAIRKIEEVVNELGRNYSSVDEPLIVMYAQNYERYIELEKKLVKDGVTTFSPKTGAEYMSPTFTASLAVQKNLVTIANQLGLSIASRKRLGIRMDDSDSDTPSLFDIASSLNDDDGLFDDL